MTTQHNTKRGPKAISETSSKKAKALLAISVGKQDFTHYYKHQIVKTGLATFEDVQTGTRGRPAKVLVLTGKGRSYLAASRNWFKKIY